MQCSLSIRAFFALGVLLLPLQAMQAQELASLVSPFDGSAVVGTYQARFAPLTLLTEPLDAKKVPSTMSVEGALHSTIYTRPEGVAEFEVYSSYKQVLTSANFDLLLACETGKCDAKVKARSIYGRPNQEIEKRAYGQMPTSTTSWLSGWVDYYISAKKKTADRTYYVMILVSTQRNLYSVDVMAVEEMAAGSVTLAPELLQAKIRSEGKAVLDGLFFETGKAVITDASKPSLTAIASYLKANASLSFYVVGHTDDVGNVESNLTLSKSRALAVIEALKGYGVNTAKLMGDGVGPFSPATSNQSDAGKASNRRVELVLRLE